MLWKSAPRGRLYPHTARRCIVLCTVPVPIDIPTAEALCAILRGRADMGALRRRLATEKRSGHPIQGRSGPFAYAEEWLLRPWLLRAALRATGLHARGRRNALAIESNSHVLESERLPAVLHGFRLLHLSDLHIDVSREFEQALHQRVSDVSFDLCVITGDLRYRDRGDPRPALAAMARMRPLLGGRALLVLGNHDSVRWLPYLERVGYEVLLNEATDIVHKGARLHIAGVDDRGYFGADDIRSASADIPEDAPAMLLSHSPEIVADELIRRFDFVLCGHTHGGQIRLPGGLPLVTNARCARRYCSGSWRHGTVSGYTSLGAGSSLLDVRFNCPPEITIHQLASSKGRLGSPQPPLAGAP